MVLKCKKLKKGYSSEIFELNDSSIESRCMLIFCCQFYKDILKINIPISTILVRKLLSFSKVITGYFGLPDSETALHKGSAFDPLQLSLLLHLAADLRSSGLKNPPGYCTCRRSLLRIIVCRFVFLKNPCLPVSYSLILLKRLPGVF